MKSYLAALISLLLLIAACHPVADQSELVANPATRTEDIATIRQRLEDFAAVHNGGDASSLAAFYTEDGVLMPPNEPAAVGRQAIQAFFQRQFDQFNIELALSSEEVIIVGDWAFDRGTHRVSLTPTAGGEPILEIGKYIAISHRQQDGSWELSHDIFNSDLPLPSAGQ